MKNKKVDEYKIYADLQVLTEKEIKAQLIKEHEWEDLAEDIEPTFDE